MALFLPWSYRQRDGHSCLATETGIIAFLAVDTVAKLQRVSSEDRKTPVRGQAVKQSAEMRSSPHAPIVVVGKVPV